MAGKRIWPVIAQPAGDPPGSYVWEWVETVGGVKTHRMEDEAGTIYDFLMIASGGTFTADAILRGAGGGQLIQDSGVFIDDADNITGVQTITMNGNFDLDGNVIILDGDADSYIDGSVDDVVSIAAGTAAGVIAFLVDGAVDVTISANSLNIPAGSVLTMGGNDILLDADGDSYLHALADDDIELVLPAGGEFAINIAAAEDFIFTANQLDCNGSSIIGGGGTISDFSGLSLYKAAPLTVEIKSDRWATVYIEAYNEGTAASILEFQKARGEDYTSPTVVVDDDNLGSIIFEGWDGDEWRTAASIIAQVDGTPGDDDMPGRLVFATTADGAATPTDRVIIDSGGNVWLDNSLYLEEQAAADGDVAGWGQVFVKDDDPNTLWFRDDDGTEVQLGVGGGGGGTRTMFFPNPNATDWKGDYATHEIASSDTTMSFYVPAEASSLDKVYVVLIPGDTNGAWPIDLDSDYAADGEAYNTHSETDNASTYALTNNEMTFLDVTAKVFNALAPGDMGGLTFDNDDGADIDVLGILVKYTMP